MKLRRSESAAFLIDCEYNTLRIASSVIEYSSSLTIIGSGVLSFLNSENAVIKNNVSFYFNVIAVSPFNLIIISVVNKALDEVYRKAVQHLF